jgi:hypothetical protein
MKLFCARCGSRGFRFLPENGRNERLECTTCGKILAVYPAERESEAEGVDHLAWTS